MSWSHRNDRFFLDRHDAGHFLAEKLAKYKNNSKVIVLALPRGGVPVGYEIARHLKVPLDIFLVRKLGVPFYEELAMGAIATGGVRVLNPEVVKKMGITEEMIETVAQEEERELNRRESEYRGDRPSLELRGRIVILVDDGLATGASMRAAVAALKQHEPDKIIVAVPVGAAETCKLFEHEVDEVICGMVPEDFVAVGRWYKEFRQITDEEVIELLNNVSHRQKVQQLMAEHPEKYSYFI
jgi:putative phosphoribosyl transferase